MKDVAIIFYEDTTGVDCDVWEVFGSIQEASEWLEKSCGWTHHDRGYWSSPKYNGKAYILVREVY